MTEYTLVKAEPEILDRTCLPYTEIIFLKAQYYLVKAPAEIVHQFCKKGAKLIEELPGTLDSFVDTFREPLNRILADEKLLHVHAQPRWLPRCAMGGAPTTEQIIRRNSRLQELYAQFKNSVESAKAKLALA